MAILLAVSIFVTTRSSAHGINPIIKKRQGCCSDQPAILRRMVGTYYTTKDGFQSTLILNNKGPNQLLVTPILRSQNGETFTASPVAVGGQSSSEVDLNLLASIAGPQFNSGSLEFTYEGRLLEMGGGLRIVNVEKSLIFDEQMLEPGMKFPSSQLEAVYAVPFEDSQVNVIVTNTSAQPILVNGDAIFAGTNGHHPIQSRLEPHQTQIVKLPQGLIKRASAGAVSLNHNGDKGALLAMVYLEDTDRGYSESVNFIDPGGKTNERHGAGLRLGSIDNDPLRAVIAVRNIGENPTAVTATVPYLKQNGDTGTIALPQVTLAPGEIKLLKTSNPQLRQNDFATAGLEIKYTGEPGSVIATASSVSQNGNHVFALPMKDPQSGLSSTGGYPWFINETSSTVVFIKNVTNESQEFMLSIVYTGGQWSSNVRTLAAGQTFALDVRKLRDSQEKGSDGSEFPLSATSGHVSWSNRGNKNKVLIGRAQTVDFSNGLASTYECQCICGWSWGDEARILPGSVSSFPGDSGAFQIQSRYRNCFGADMGWWTLTDYALNNLVTYSSDNPDVATFVAPGTGTAIAPGATYLRAQWTEYYQEYNESYGFCAQIAATALCAAFCDVQRPSISGPTSVWWFDGQTPPSYATQITLTASPSTASSYQWVVVSGTDKVDFENNSDSMTTTTNSVIVKSTGMSTFHEVGLRVTVNGVTSNIRQLSVRAPHRLVLNRDFVHMPNGSGYETRIFYRIEDQFTDLLPSSVPINEFFTTPTIDDFPGSDWVRGPAGAATVSPAEWFDRITGGSGTIPMPSNPCSPQLCNTKVHHFDGEWRVGSLQIGVGRRVQTNRWQRYTDHAEHHNRISPAP
jgi:hypothetical protein